MKIFCFQSFTHTNGKKWLMVLSAGRRKWRYSLHIRSVQDLNWTELILNMMAVYLNGFEQLEKFSDIFLIDSRTGVSEMSGVSTRHLADVIVVIMLLIRRILQAWPTW